MILFRRRWPWSWRPCSRCRCYSRARSSTSVPFRVEMMDKKRNCTRMSRNVTGRIWIQKENDQKWMSSLRISHLRGSETEHQSFNLKLKLTLALSFSSRTALAVWMSMGDWRLPSLATGNSSYQWEGPSKINRKRYVKHMMIKYYTSRGTSRTSTSSFNWLLENSAVSIIDSKLLHESGKTNTLKEWKLISTSVYWVYPYYVAIFIFEILSLCEWFLTSCLIQSIFNIRIINLPR